MSLKSNERTKLKISKFSGEIKIDESYFGYKRLRAKEVEAQQIKHRYLEC